jgi:hypothetical protein
MGTPARQPSLWRQRLAVLAVVAAVASPAVRGRDSFPLSTYPVYANARDRFQMLYTAVGVRPDGTWSRLSLPLIADTDDPLIAEDRVADAVNSGRAEALCTAIAARLRQTGRAVDPADTHADTGVDNEAVVAVEVVAERVDLVAVATAQAAPMERTVHARCQATR